VAPAKAADRAVVRCGVRREPAEGHVGLAAALDLARGGDPGRVGVEEELQHHARVIGRSARRGCVGGVDRREVEQLFDHLGDKARLVVPRQPVVERRAGAGRTGTGRSGGRSSWILNRFMSARALPGAEEDRGQAHGGGRDSGPRRAAPAVGSTWSSVAEARS
jgi:hypothetical protein